MSGNLRWSNLELMSEVESEENDMNEENDTSEDENTKR